MSGIGRVVVVGSINADWVVEVAELPGPGETVVGDRISRRHGGKGANQAVAAARAGAVVAIVGAVGDDAVGDGELGDLDTAGVNREHVRRLSGTSTGVALITVDSRGENQITVAPGANGRLTAEWVDRALLALTLSPRDVVLICHEIDDAAVGVAIRAGADANARVILNPAPPRDLNRSAPGRLAVLTPNRPEALALSGSSAIEEAARALSVAIGGATVVTVGSAGAIIALPAERELTEISAPVSEPVDTVGAGDVFNGILAARLAAGDVLREAVAAAVERASESTQWPGARAPADWPQW